MKTKIKTDIYIIFFLDSLLLIWAMMTEGFSITQRIILTIILTVHFYAYVKKA